MKNSFNYCCLLLLLFLFGSSKKMLAQNAGIGIATPLEKLHVGGNIKADMVKPNAIKILPNAAAGKILTSDASGNGIWQTNTALTTGNVGFGFWGDCATNATISEYNPVASDTVGLGIFGNSVSISGNYALVGDKGAGPNASQGNACVYQYNGSNWVLMQKLTDATGAADDWFGSSVSISGNIAIVGAERDDVGANSNQGSASIYQFNGTSWVFMQKIIDAGGTTDERFGVSVAVSGNYVIIGAHLDDVGANVNQGSASIYQFNGTNWVFMQKLTDAAGTGSEFFGSSVAISSSYAVVGAPLGKVGSNVQQGYVNIYQLSAGTWIFMQKLTDPAGVSGEGLGNSVSLSGNTVVIGEEQDVVGSNSSQGSASVFEYNGTTWVWTQRLVDPEGESQDRFGYSVAISGNYIMVCALFDNVGIYTDKGSATIYQRVGLGWSKLQFVTDPVNSPASSLGRAVAIDPANKRFLIGGYGRAIFGKIN